MMNLDLIAEQLFNSVKGRFGNLTIGNEQGDVTNVPKEARFFDFDFGPQAKPIGKVSVSLDEENGIVIIYNKDMIDENYGQHKNDWFTFLKDMRMFSKRRLLKFEVRDITRSNLQKRDYKFLATNRPGDNTMSESKMYGNHKTSFQKFGSAKLSIKHNGTIGEGESRTSKIGSLFIETVDGEKFKYPFKHLSGARALATHIGEGGHAYDDFGKHITGLSEELSKLRKFNQYLNRSSVMAETLSKYTGNVKERMTSIKKEIANLQKPSYYTEAVKNYTVPVMEEVPNDVAENWIDQLTVKQFNEELKDIFPYIYNLVSESTLAETLTPESFLSEQDTYHKVSPGETITSIAQKYADHFPGGVQQGVEEIVDANGIANPKLIQVGTELVIPRVASEPVNIGGMPGGSTRGIDPKDNYSAADFKRLTNPSMEAAFEAALNTLMGQFAESINETKCNCDDEKCDDPRNHMDENEGNAYSGAVAKAKMNGKKKGDTIPHPDKDEDDIVIEKEKTPLGEFVLSYFDREQGTFPKGPTAVLTMVEKEYGEAYIKPAMEFIERIDAKVAEVMGYKETDVEENFLSRMIGAEGVKPDDFVKKAMKISQRYEKLAFQNKIASDPNRPFNGQQGGKFLLDLYMELINMSREIQKMGGGNKTMKNAQQQMSLIKQAMAGSYDNPEAARLMKAARYEPKFIIDFVKQDIQSMGESQDTDESALMGHIGKKKYGKDGMTALSKAGRDGASEEELGRIKDKYKKESQDILKLAGLN